MLFVWRSLPAVRHATSLPILSSRIISSFRRIVREDLLPAPLTCWPFDAVTSGPLRYVLHARMVEDVTR